MPISDGWCKPVPGDGLSERCIQIIRYIANLSKLTGKTRAADTKNHIRSIAICRRCKRPWWDHYHYDFANEKLIDAKCIQTVSNRFLLDRELTDAAYVLYRMLGGIGEPLGRE